MTTSLENHRPPSRWPWLTGGLAGLLALLPHVHAVVGAAWRYSVTDWLRDLWLAVALGGIFLLAGLAAMEMLVRRRLRRR